MSWHALSSLEEMMTGSSVRTTCRTSARGRRHAAPSVQVPRGGARSPVKVGDDGSSACRLASRTAGPGSRQHPASCDGHTRNEFRARIHATGGGMPPHARWDRGGKIDAERYKFG